MQDPLEFDDFVDSAGYEEYEFKDDIKINGLRFEMTCQACPEQYDVYKGKQLVGYVRLRWGTVRCDVPDCAGDTIYRESVGNDGFRGVFSDEAERMLHLTEIAKRINASLAQR